MLFPSASIIEARRQLLYDLDKGIINADRMYRQALELDPEDFVPMVFLGENRAEAGDAAGAEELFWRAIRIQPCAWAPYFRLSELLMEQEPLSKGLAELACRKVLLDPEALEDLTVVGSPLLEDIEDAAGLEAVADRLREERDLEPMAVTAQLRSLRLVHQVQEADDLDAEGVDAVLQEGASIVPLLVGVLRGWAQDVLAENDTYIVADAMALLGEIGDAGAIPYLLELVSLEDVELSGPCGWALDRIVEQHPEDAARVFMEVAAGLGGEEKIAVAERVLRFPEVVATAELFEKLLENLDRLEREDREACFEVLVSASIMVMGQPGIEFARTMLRRQGEMLSRKGRRDYEEMIEEFNAIGIPPRPPAEPSPWSVYDVCSGTIDWVALAEEEAREQDEELGPLEPVRRAPKPGRNDPCWCGSGKKYKKCHLDADERPGKSRVI